MFQIENATKTDGRKILALIALAGASIMAYNAGNYLSKAGVVYYTICAIALLLNYRRANLLLWAAVGGHAVLVGYSLWQWQAAQVIPCIYCFGAAGFALLAAVVYTRPAAAVVPVVLIAAAWFAWPYVFAADGLAGVNQKPGLETQYQIPVQQPANQPADVKPDAAADNGKTIPTAQVGASSIQTGTQQEQTPAATNTDNQQGNASNPNVPGDVTPIVKPDSGTAEKPAEPAKPGSS
jgi:hypothetical protein